MISADWCISRYAEVLAALPDDITEQGSAHPELLLHSEKFGRQGSRTLKIYYTPFGWVNTSARVVLVGITPGRQQHHLAVREAGNALRSGRGHLAAVRAANERGSFAGHMRTTLIEMLDGIGLAEALGIGGCGALFAERSDLVATTSAICHAVFVDDDNYGGKDPKIARVPVLRSFAEQVLAANLAMVAEALVVPLGKEATAAVEMCVSSGAVDPARCLVGFPHPSGADNGHRVRQYPQTRKDMESQVEAWAAATHGQCPSAVRAQPGA